MPGTLHVTHVTEPDLGVGHQFTVSKTNRTSLPPMTHNFNFDSPNCTHIDQDTIPPLHKIPLPTKNVYYVAPRIDLCHPHRQQLTDHLCLRLGRCRTSRYWHAAGELGKGIREEQTHSMMSRPSGVDRWRDPAQKLPSRERTRFRRW